MKKRKQIFLTITGIAFTIFLFLFAMYFPRYLNAFFDEKTLNNVTRRNLNLKTYEISYDSFYEKLHAIARCKKEELHVVDVQKAEAKQEKEKITKIIQREIALLSQESNIMFRNITLKPSNFVSCETFTLYSSGDTERLKGITYWKIMYRKKKETFLFYMDEEYHKIYALEVTRKENNIFNYDGSNAEGLMDAEQMGYQINDVPFSLLEYSYIYLDYLTQYYNLERGSFFPVDDGEMNSMGDFLFADKAALTLGCHWERKVRKKNNYITMLLGIYLDPMLQF